MFQAFISLVLSNFGFRKKNPLFATNLDAHCNWTEFVKIIFSTRYCKRCRNCSEIFRQVHDVSCSLKQLAGQTINFYKLYHYAADHTLRTTDPSNEESQLKTALTACCRKAISAKRKVIANFILISLSSSSNAQLYTLLNRKHSMFRK